MQLRSLLPAALALAASAGAFLVPPNTDGDAIDAFNSHPVDTGKAAGIRIPCQGCYVTEDAIKDTDLVLEFSQKDNKIYLGQTPVYPLNPAAASAMGRQVMTQDSDFEMADTEVHLSTRMEVVNTVPLNDKGLTVSEFRLEVLGIDDRVVHVGTVSFAVFDHHDDKTVAMSEPKLIPTVTTPADASCTTVMCRVRAQIAAKVAALKAAAGKFKSGCMRMMGMHPHGPHHHGHHHGHQGHHGHPEEKPKDVSADRTEQTPPSNPMDRLKGGPEKIKGMMGGKKPCPGRHGAIRKLIHGVAVFAKHVLMPVLVGVAAGMAVSAFGMVVGQLIFMIVMRLRARRNGGYVVVVSEDDIDDLEARLEKEDEIDDLPRYEAGEHVLPPAYDEKRDGEQH